MLYIMVFSSLNAVYLTRRNKIDKICIETISALINSRFRQYFKRAT
nr:MAG TPA: hypothetical protein [Bacteriophage sp.]DAX07211.1 MAG TPA: hypothetical protein [Bacteriophage sp.]DAZ43542.1 MAG TPA: hypothetical protein [Caudoviricetes sp.]